MKKRYVFRLKEPMTLEQLCSIMEERWDKTNFNIFIKRKPDEKAYEEFIMLPATYHHVVMIYTEKKKLVMGIFWPRDSLAEELADKITYSSPFYNNAQASRELPPGRDRMDTFPQALYRYAFEMKRILKDKLSE